jgi:hypothetical protein
MTAWPVFVFGARSLLPAHCQSDAGTKCNGGTLAVNDDNLEFDGELDL